MLSVQGGQVKLGLEAPKGVNITRTEILEKIQPS